MNALCVFVFLFGVVSCDLTIGRTKECGQITCDYLYYCSLIDNACKPCRRVCEPGGNYDAMLCNNHCQDYIHDMRYLNREDVLDNTKEQFEKLQVLTMISLIFSLIVFVCFVLVAVILCFNKKTKLKIFSISAQMKSRKEKPAITRKDDSIPMNGDEISTIRLQNDAIVTMEDITDIMHSKTMPPHDDYLNITTFKNHHARSEPDSVSSVYTDKTNKTTQPLAKRLPSEDSTLDFIYDNPTLAPSLNPDMEASSGDSRKKSDSDT